jgi:protein-S-isoprenylcysteine O-methyltransferase Ste14
MEDINQLKQEIILIKQRNARVEADKAWETSNTRRIFIAAVTYITMCLLMYSIGVKDFYVSAIVPTIGFLLSTISLGFVKIWWLNRQK